MIISAWSISYRPAVYHPILTSTRSSRPSWLCTVYSYQAMAALIQWTRLSVSHCQPTMEHTGSTFVAWIPATSCSPWMSQQQIWHSFQSWYQTSCQSQWPSIQAVLDRTTTLPDCVPTDMSVTTILRESLHTFSTPIARQPQSSTALLNARRSTTLSPPWR